MGDKRICRPDSPQDGPMDGVTMTTDCIRTDFLDNQKENEAAFQQYPKATAHISASNEIGIFSIRDMENGVMLTVSLQDAMELMAAAADAARESEKCIEKISGNAETVEKE